MIGPGRAIGKPANIALHLSYDRRCAHCVPVPEHRNNLCHRATANVEEATAVRTLLQVAFISVGWTGSSLEVRIRWRKKVWKVCCRLRLSLLRREGKR